ncbi:kinase-like domain-containing protein [Rhizophagus irregularis DAOM 181602=DAOM 197198]|nr:kinase-like domain-containing protein [Rhizophagus irregularis DAOM 181602=DAOM 197198]POG76297.1 kinase-like domain-containing protein [Rhizophagus irregularis DAOM 181602=DAOM 197198]|eukprot:XP_025183163.1 kinase-like domain-containing protein [Rhizophagus irregularis DAOM 181602=DAOM 197198]
MCNLAAYYRDGVETEKNLEKALYWYQKAAEKDHTIAMFNLANYYYNGKGTEKNFKKAFYWYQKAAENGQIHAMYNLVAYYRNGEETEKNLEKSFYWCQKAAKKGHIDAIFNLAACYRNGEGTEKDFEKAFYWCQEAAEKDHIIAMFNLANHYYNGKGAEMNFEKAFYWCQKAAEKGQIDAMYNLAVYYRNGKGAEKNFEKAFYWYQKAAKKDHIIAMFNLANHYHNGEGTEKNLEKAFHWYQKAAETGQIDAMYKLAIYYRNGEGTEKNFEKAFRWCQKAAENGQIDAMCNLANYYYNGEGTEKNLERAFYWHQKAVESNKMNHKNGVEFCNECKQPNNNYQWCQQCNAKQFQQDFSKWTSKNEFINKFIQEAQLNAKNSYEILEWIPYNELSNIKYYDKGGFCEIHKAIWSDGPIFSWNFDKQQWNRQTYYEVILKKLNNSSSLNNEFLNEWKYHYNCQKKSFSKFIQFFGFTQDPNNLNYLIVMSYAKEGSLRKCLSDIIKFKWQDKLQLLKKIILGLKVIHESNLTHGDFHDGNILISDNYNELFVIDLGLCKPISDLQNADNDNNEIYGVLPYMAPEILRKKPYTSASDIYSFSMIMWEFTSGIPPFDHEGHDHDLILSVYKGKRPKIVENTPKCYSDLMEKCWDLNPSNRPTIIMLENIISEWIKYINRYYEVNRDDKYQYEIPDIDNQLRNDMLEFVEANKSLMQKQANTSSITQSYSNSQAYYTETSIQEGSQGFDCMIDDHH